MTLVAGVDSSTQSCKVVVRDVDTGALVRQGRAPHPEGTSADPERWWDALLEAVSDADGLTDVEAIAVAGQQHGMVALDQGGRTVRDALLWHDTRSAAAAEQLIAEFGSRAWADAVGSVPRASYTATKLRWLRDNEPDAAGRVAAVALPHDYLTWRLAGHGPEHADLGALITDRSDASGTGYWSPSEERYRLDLLEAVFGAVPVLPRVLGPSAPAGLTGGGIPGVPEGIVLGPGAGDNAAAALGLGATAGEVVISIGTSGTVSAVTPTPTSDACGLVAGFADATGRYLPLIATLNAARVIEVAETLLGIGHEELSDLALSAAPGSEGLVLVPYLEGERTPNLPTATGTVRGMSLASATRANLARAMVEGMLCGLADGLDAITSHGVETRRLLLIGGGARSAAVQQIAPEVFGLPVTVPVASEYVADGAARQASWVLSGALPRWSQQTGATLEAEPRPEIRAAYRSAQHDLGYQVSGAPVDRR